MNEEAFRSYLKRGGRSESATERVLRFTRGYAAFLQEHGGRTLDESTPEDLIEFARTLDEEKKNTKGYLWAVGYYYRFVSDEEMSTLAGELRSGRISRAPTPLSVFPGLNTDYLERLASIGIKNVEQMLSAGKNEDDWKEISERCGVPPEAIMELLRLSELSRIPGIKGTRARLYYEAGIDTLEKLAQWDPEEMREMLVEFVGRTGFKGVAPWPREAEYSVEAAKRLVRGENVKATSL